MDIAKRMRARRKEQKLSQVQLSRRSDVSLGTLKRFALGCENDFDALFAKKGYSSIQEVINEQL